MHVGIFVHFGVCTLLLLLWSQLKCVKDSVYGLHRAYPRVWIFICSHQFKFVGVFVNNMLILEIFTLAFNARLTVQSVSIFSFLTSIERERDWGLFHCQK